MASHRYSFDAPKFVDFQSTGVSPKNPEEYFAQRKEEFTQDYLNAEDDNSRLTRPDTIFQFNAEGEQQPRRSSLRRYSLRSKPGKKEAPKICDTRSPVAKKPRKSLIPKESPSPAAVRPKDRRVTRSSNSFLVTVMKPKASSAEKPIRKRKSVELDSRAGRSHSFNRDVIPRKVTKVEPFKFAASRRTREAPMADEYKPIDFKATLRRNAQNAASKPTTGVTKVRPFNLSENRKRKHEPAQPYVSMAEQLKRFEVRTPARFRVKPPTPPHPTLEGPVFQLTRPVSPKLHTVSRRRPNTVMSQQDKDQQEIETIRKYRFKANPVDQRIYASTIGMPELKHHDTTKPVNFKLSTMARVQNRVRKSESEEVFEFRARPAPKKILEGVVGLGKKVEMPTTKPKSPEFALKKRQSSWQTKHEETASEPPTMELRPRPRVLVTSRPPTLIPLLEKKCTNPEPFSFYSKDVTRFTQKENRIKEEVEKKSKPFEFRANPVPSPTPSALPAKNTKPVTEPSPFQLLIDQRGDAIAAKWQRQMEDDLRVQKEAMEFRAQPCTVVKKSPFVPTKYPKPLLEASSIVLNTDMRAVERQLFDEQKKTREETIEEEKHRRELEREEEELRKVAELRAQMVHKAKPVRHFQPVVIRPSEKQPTQAKTPNFRTTLRCLRHDKEN